MTIEIVQIVLSPYYFVFAILLFSGSSRSSLRPPQGLSQEPPHPEASSPNLPNALISRQDNRTPAQIGKEALAPRYERVDRAS
jgi:hypothetical protein